MKRAGFTMIELIFVIVIIGILSAVALPKFIGVSTQAKVAKLTAYAGTLDRTTLPPYWSKSLTEGHGGSVTTYAANILSDLGAPDQNSSATTTAVSFANKFMTAGTAFADNTPPAPIVGQWTYNSVVYDLGCVDGDAEKSAHCDIYNAGTGKWLLKDNQ